MRFDAVRLHRKHLEAVRDSGGRISISTIGIVYADEDVSEELVRATVEKATVYGRIIAAPAVRSFLSSINTAGGTQ